MPESFLIRVTSELGIDLPPRNYYGVGMAFLPQEDSVRSEVKELMDTVRCCSTIVRPATKVQNGTHLCCACAANDVIARACSAPCEACIGKRASPACMHLCGRAAPAHASRCQRADCAQQWLHCPGLAQRASQQGGPRQERSGDRARHRAVVHLALQQVDP